MRGQGRICVERRVSGPRTFNSAHHIRRTDSECSAQFHQGIECRRALVAFQHTYVSAMNVRSERQLFLRQPRLQPRLLEFRSEHGAEG